MGRGLAAGCVRVSIANVNEISASELNRAVERVEQACRAEATASSDIDILRDHVVADRGGVDILANSARITHLAPAEEFPESHRQSVIDVNLTRFWSGCRALGAYILENGCGGNANLSSIAGSVGLRRTVAYYPSKGGADQPTRAMAVEWVRREVRVNSVAPPWFPTDMASKLEEIPDFKESALIRFQSVGRATPRNSPRPSYLWQQVSHRW